MKVDQNQINKWKEKGLSVVEHVKKYAEGVQDVEAYKKAMTKQPRRAKKQNKTESAYALQLEALKQVGEIAHYEFEAITLKLADGTRYTPDFFVVKSFIVHVGKNTGISYPETTFEFVEVKGAHIWDDSKVKFKVARKMFPWFKFKMMQWKDKVWTELYPE